jgi:hypothetical protein
MTVLNINTSQEGSLLLFHVLPYQGIDLLRLSLLVTN